MARNHIRPNDSSTLDNRIGFLTDTATTQQSSGLSSSEGRAIKPSRLAAFDRAPGAPVQRQPHVSLNDPSRRGRPFDVPMLYASAATAHGRVTSGVVLALFPSICIVCDRILPRSLRWRCTAERPIGRSALRAATPGEPERPKSIPVRPRPPPLSPVSLPATRRTSKRRS